MKQYHTFRPECIELASPVPGVELDQEVASIVANHVYDRNNRHNNSLLENNHRYGGEVLALHLLQRGDSYGPEYAAAHGQPRGFHIFTPNVSPCPEYNATAAIQIQRALDSDERTSRADIGFTLGLGGTFSVAGLGGGVLASLEGFSHDNAAWVTVGWCATAMGGIIAAPTLHNLYRRAATHERIQWLRLQNVARSISKLGLPPMLSVRPARG